MKKHLLEFIITELLLTLLIYFAAVFVSGKFDPMDMSSLARLFELVIWCLGSAFNLSFFYNFEDE